MHASKAWIERFLGIFETQEDMYNKVARRKEVLGSESDRICEADDLPPEKIEILKF